MVNLRVAEVYETIYLASINVKKTIDQEDAVKPIKHRGTGKAHAIITSDQHEDL